MPLADPFPAGTGASATTLTAISRNFRTAAVAEWSAGIQREVASNLVLDVSYFGSKGAHLPVSYNLNQPRPGAGTLAQVLTELGLSQSNLRWCFHQSELPSSLS